MYVETTVKGVTTGSTSAPRAVVTPTFEYSVVFVADSVLPLRRVLYRAGWIRGDEPYDGLRKWCEARLPGDAEALGEFHALIVRHAKERCRKTAPACDGCPVAECAAASGRDLNAEA